MLAKVVINRTGIQVATITTTTPVSLPSITSAQWDILGVRSFLDRARTVIGKDRMANYKRKKPRHISYWHLVCKRLDPKVYLSRHRDKQKLKKEMLNQI